MNRMHAAGRLLAGLLIGLGIAVTVKTATLPGSDGFELGYIFGPGLVVAGIVRLKLQRLLDEQRGGGADEHGGGDDGPAS